MKESFDYQSELSKTLQSTLEFRHNNLKSNPDFVTIFDKNCQIIFSNEKETCNPITYRQNTSFPYCIEALHPEPSEQCKTCHIKAVFQTGTSQNTVRNFPGIGNLEIHAFPIVDNFSATILVGQSLRKIDKRHKVENALPDSNQMLEAIIEGSPLAIIALDHQINLLIWNSAAERLFGWQKEEVIGKPYPIASESLMSEVMENIRRLDEGKLRHSIETCRMHKNGTLIDVSLSTAPMCNSDGDTIGYMAIFADIRERKQSQEALRESEANYRTIFDAANDATFVFEPEKGAMLDVNLKMCDMYGYTREEVLRLNVEALSAGKPPYTYDDLLQKIWKTRQNTSHLFEWLAKDCAGRLFWVEVNMKDAIIGGEYRVLAVVKDITERKATEEANRKMQQRLRQIDKMAAIGTLASGIAHEINNPNNFILSNAQFAADIWPDISRILRRYAEENEEFYLGRLRFSEAEKFIPNMLKGLVEGSHRINNIVTGLKDFARQEKTQLDNTIDINHVIEMALAMLHNQIGKHTDKFQWIKGQILPQVTGSFQQLEQVIVNLTLNALQALPDRNAGISIRTSHIESQRQVMIEVRDEGVGMPLDVQQKIFDPFFTTRLDSGGTGLGLSICFSIIKEHGGIIEFDSEPEKGTTFSVKLPVLAGEKNKGKC